MHFQYSKRFLAEIKNKAFIIVPAWNEEHVIRHVINDLKSYFDNVIVIDDCSTDSTSKASYESGATVISHPINLGQGACLQTGFDFAFQKKCKYIVTFDGDGQHLAIDAVSFLLPIYSESVDVVLGSRFLSKSAIGMPIQRRLLLFFAIFFTKIFSKINITDTHNGLRAFSCKAAKTIQITQNKMAHASEIIHLISQSNLRFIEMANTVIYSPYSLKKGQKNSNIFSIIIDLLLDLIK